MRRGLGLWVVLAMLALPPVAQALKLGKLDPARGPFSLGTCGYDHVIYVAGASPTPIYAFDGRPTAQNTIPAGRWTITSWSTNHQHASDTVRLAVTRFDHKRGGIDVLARSQIKKITSREAIVMSHGATPVTFATRIPVRGGEQFGLDVPTGASDCEWGGLATFTFHADDELGHDAFDEFAGDDEMAANIRITLRRR